MTTQPVRLVAPPAMDRLTPVGTGSLIYFRGLPGCGKSTETARLRGMYGDRCVVLERDAFRVMWGCLPLGTPEQEAVITWTVDAAARELLGRGSVVVIDGTNLRSEDGPHWETLAAECGVPVRCVDLTHVTVEECIRRDHARRDAGGRHVGEAVIRAMAWRAGLG
jgi:predicted kinase